MPGLIENCFLPQSKVTDKPSTYSLGTSVVPKSIMKSSEPSLGPKSPTAPARPSILFEGVPLPSSPAASSPRHSTDALGPSETKPEKKPVSARIEIVNKMCA